MQKNFLEVIVIGAGQAGLSASYYLKKHGLPHIVLERGRIGESWRSQRWDSFVMNTASDINLLPGQEVEPRAEKEFISASAFASGLATYVSDNELPVKENCRVLSVTRDPQSRVFTVTVAEQQSVRSYHSKQVIVASGAQNQSKAPAFANRLPPEILQLHAGEYRNAAQLPGAAVLIVGSAQSGCQIAEDVLASGRKVYLSTSMVPRIPRRYRGWDIMDWLMAIGFFDAKTEDVTDPKMLHMTAPQLTGTGGGRQTISLQALRRKGVTLLGKVEDTNGRTLNIQPNVGEHVQFADTFSRMVKGMIDEVIIKKGISAPPPEEDADDLGFPDVSALAAISSLDLEEHHIRSVIWATGFSADFSYLKLPVLDNTGYPLHLNGVSEVEGMYFLGLPWLRSRQSSLVHGADADARFIVEKAYLYSLRPQLSRMV